MKAVAWFRRLPWSIVVLSSALMTLGLLAIGRSVALTAAPAPFFARQAAWMAISLVAMLLATLPNYRILIRASYALLCLSMVLLVAVYFFPPINGAHRWLRFGPVGMQPSEFAKPAFVLGLARYLMYRESYRQWWGLMIALVLVMGPVLLILKEPDLGTALVFLPVLFVMLFAAGARLEHLLLVVLAGIASLPLLWSQMSREQRSRITALAEQTAGFEQPTDDGYHLHRSKQMLALGGTWGSFLAGDAVADRGAYSVPEAHTDSVASVLTERFGLWGFGLLLLLFLALVGKALSIADTTREPFGRLVAIGLGTLFGVQALINTGMMVGLLPITGLALPLVSYGGSSLLANSLSLGLLLNIGLRPGYEVAKEPFRFAAR